MDHPFDLQDYLAESNRALVRTALRASLSHPAELLFLLRAAFGQARATRRRAAYEKRGRHIPSFLIASITDRCNLSCAGCYARANRPCEGSRGGKVPLSTERWGALFREARALGIGFILLAGGEPMLRVDVLEEAARCPGILFPVFTNGTRIDAAAVRLFRRNRHLVPILSLEGDREETDARRGAGTFAHLEEAMARFRRRGIPFGASITVTTANVRKVSEDGFLADLLARGCLAVLFIEYVPVSQDSRLLAPGEAERRFLEKRLAVLRGRHRGTNFLSFPGDEKELDGCLAAGRGFFHINPEGGAEPCPFSPYSDTSVKSGSLLDALASPLFLQLDRDGLMRGEHTGGCLLFEREEEVRRMLAVNPPQCRE